MQRLSKKYQQIEYAAKEKVENQTKKWKEKRTEYLNHVKRLEETREAMERASKEKADKIMNQMELKATHANRSKMEILEQITKRKIETNTNRMKELRNLRARRDLELSQRKLLREKQEAEKDNSKQMKSYQEYLKALKREIETNLRSGNITEDLSNPYIVAELKITQEHWKNKRCNSKMGLDEKANKTSGKFDG